MAESRRAALLAYTKYGRTFAMKDLEAFRLAAEHWQATATNNDEETRNAKAYTRIAHQLTTLYTGKKSTP